MWLKLSATCLALALLNGCALFGSELDEAAKGAGKLVTFYCKNVTDDTLREEFRATVNRHAAPHSVAVTCASGVPTP